MRRHYPIILAVSAAIVGAACGESARTPAAANIAGSWSGTLTSTVAAGSTAVATISMTLTQTTLPLIPPSAGNEVLLSGSWSMSASPAVPSGTSGTLLGNISGAGVTAQLTPNDGVTCSTNIDATLSSATSMTGTYTSCTSGSDHGTFAATKQQ